MKKIIKISVLLSFFLGLVNQVSAWECGQPCPSSFTSGRTECLVYNETCSINTPSSEDLWGRAGSVAMPLAEKTMKARNKSKEPLSERQKHALRAIFGNLVDKINVRYNSKMLDKWSALGKEISLSKVDTVGQAYGYDVFIVYPKSRFNSEPADMLHLLIHEITHVQQMRDIKNTVSDFGYKYFWEYKAANQNYENNKLEKEADAKANSNYEEAYKRYNSFNNCQNASNIIIKVGNETVTFNSNKSWVTCTGYRTVFQGDGNFVVYNPSNNAVFHTSTHSQGGKTLAMQTDGNLVIYTADKKALWHSHTNGNPGAFLAIQQDGNVVIYSKNGTPLWFTETNGK